MVHRSLVAPLIVASAFLSSSEARSQPGSYVGSNATPLTLPGCNASAFAQLPGDPSLFIGRQLLTADGQLAPPAQANDCSGGNPENSKIGKSYNRWSLMLDRFDWKSGRFEVVKPLLDTSIDPRTGVSRAQIRGGPLSGAIIRSAYDPSVAVHNGTYYISYECTLQNGGRFHVYGTSSCISVYDPRSRTIDLARTTVLVSGVVQPDYTWAAAIPQLLERSGRLYVYWSAGMRRDGQVIDWRVRAAELEPSGAVVSVRGSSGPVPATTPLATDVWQRQPGNRTGGFILDVFGTVDRNGGLYVFYASGGPGCTSPSGTTPGCYHLSIARVDRFVRRDALDDANPVMLDLPTNPVEYAIPVRDPSGRLFLMGHFIRPPANGISELRPMPGREFWDSHKAKSVFAMAPLAGL